MFIKPYKLYKLYTNLFYFDRFVMLKVKLDTKIQVSRIFLLHNICFELSSVKYSTADDNL